MVLVATAAPAPDERPDFVVRFEGDEALGESSFDTVDGFFQHPSFSFRVDETRKEES